MLNRLFSGGLSPDCEHRPTHSRSLSSQTLPQNSVVGVDGGGTKTEAVIIDAHQRVIGEGRAGPSNPLRVGIAAAAAAVREAIDDACALAKLRRGDLIAAEIGLAGARRRELRERMRETLAPLGIGDDEVVTDAAIALYGATDGAPGLGRDCGYRIDLLRHQRASETLLRGRLGTDCRRRRWWRVARATRVARGRLCL